MTVDLWLVALLLLLTLLAAWAYFTAQRLNRLHIRTDAALWNLRGALERRAGVIGALMPEHAGLVAEVERLPLATADTGERIRAENRLWAAATAGAPPGERPRALAEAQVRVGLAHRFYNDAVTDTRALRTRPLVRLLRLGGTAPLPQYAEFVDGTAGEPPG